MDVDDLQKMGKFLHGAVFLALIEVCRQHRNDKRMDVANSSDEHSLKVQVIIFH